jgi:hypothetical protein
VSEFEAALERTHGDAEAGLKAAGGAARALKNLVAAARSGDIGKLERGMQDAEVAIQALCEQFGNTKDGWAFDTAGYLASGGLAQDILAMTRTAGLSAHMQDERVFCYPVLVRVLAGERAVLFDKVKARELRPSVVVAKLERLRKQPPRFRPDAFVQKLFQVYQIQLEREAKTMQPGVDGPAVQLSRLYELLTLFPGQDKDYSKAEFTRDLYLLDRAGETVSRDGKVEMSLHASTGTRGKPLQLVDEDGRQRDYYAVAFRTRQ